MDNDIDALDRKALRLLMRQGRVTWAELGERLKLSAPAAAERARRLEQKGVIRGYAALADPDALGYSLTAFVAVSLRDIRRRAAFLIAVAKIEEIVECHHVTGEDDYLLKVRCRGTKDLDRLLSAVLKGKLDVARSRTTIVLRTAKETVRVPLNENDD